MATAVLDSKGLQQGVLEQVLNHRGLTDQQPPGRTHEDHMLIQCLKGMRQKDERELKDARERIVKLEDDKEVLRREIHTLKRQNSDLEHEVNKQLSLAKGQGGLYGNEYCFSVFKL